MSDVGSDLVNISQKCQYALRAILELAKKSGQGPVSVSQIAEAQAIPPRFLEVILNQLRQAGLVQSRRGARGGYLLSDPPSDLSAGRVIRLVDGPLMPVDCVTCNGSADCPLAPNCCFQTMWRQAREAVAAVYDGTSFQDLLDRDRHNGRYVPQYSI